MKVIRYTFRGQSVEMGWNKVNEEIAKREADNGEYEVFEDGEPTEHLEVMGVSSYGT